MKKYFLTGLVIFLPLIITIAIIIFIINFLTKPFMGLVTELLSFTPIHKVGFFLFSSEQVIRITSQILILVALFLFTLLLGFLARLFIFRFFFNISNGILYRIPVVNKVYKTTRDIITTLFSTDKKTFKQVVLVPFPYPETYSLGLVARESPQTCQDAMGEELVSVFIPTTPNPTTGFLMMYKVKDIVFVDISTEDAIKYVVSCGVIIPEKKDATEAK